MSKIAYALNIAAVKITNIVGTMYCAIIFGCLTLISLPAAIATHDPVIIVQWVAATFLQLVLLPIIMVGQNIQSAETARLIAQIESNTATMINELRDDHAEDSEELKQILKAIHAEVVDTEPSLTPVS